MNELIYKQLKKCRVARLPPFDMQTTTLRIPKSVAANSLSILPEHYYIIKLKEQILHSPSYQVINQNWNGGSVPQSSYYKCEVLTLMGNMLRFEGIGYDWDTQQDLNDSWGGWVPFDAVEVMKELPV